MMAATYFMIGLAVGALGAYVYIRATLGCGVRMATIKGRALNRLLTGDSILGATRD
jgi:hypothetical protein